LKQPLVVVGFKGFKINSLRKWFRVSVVGDHCSVSDSRYRTDCGARSGPLWIPVDPQGYN